MKIKDTVKCPPNMGNASYVGTIVQIGGEDVDYLDNKFTWIGVSNGHHTEWWASTRLTLKKEF